MKTFLYVGFFWLTVYLLTSFTLNSWYIMDYTDNGARFMIGFVTLISSTFIFLYSGDNGEDKKW